MIINPPQSHATLWHPGSAAASHSPRYWHIHRLQLACCCRLHQACTHSPSTALQKVRARRDGHPPAAATCTHAGSSNRVQGPAHGGICGACWQHIPRCHATTICSHCGLAAGAGHHSSRRSTWLAALGHWQPLQHLALKWWFCTKQLLPFRGWCPSRRHRWTAPSAAATAA
jgi:hypothetical protein